MRGGVSGEKSAPAERARREACAGGLYGRGMAEQRLLFEKPPDAPVDKSAE